jgi:hypothetical protein
MTEVRVKRSLDSRFFHSETALVEQRSRLVCDRIVFGEFTNANQRWFRQATKLE